MDIRGIKMPNIFLIMGNPNAGKSRTIRSLTGVSRRRSRCYQVETRSGIIDIYIQLDSIQEEGKTPKEFIDYIKNNYNNIQNIFVGVWISYGDMPPGVDYIQAFLNEGWNVNQIVVLGANNIVNLPQNMPQPHYIPDSRSLPSNTIASRIRQWWQWL